jgi:NitT/TauT family transport system substrate-binding protein
MGSLRAIACLLLGLGVALAAAAAEPQPPAANRVTLMPLWSPQAQFAGYYVGIDKGIYAKHGLDVVLLPAGPGRSPVDALSTGKADFAVLWLTTALQRRDQGLPLVNLAQMVQRSSLMLVSKQASGIRSIADMNGRKVGLWGGDLSIPIYALFNRERIAVREVPQGITVNLFLRGGIDVASAMWYNEYHTLLISGVDPGELNTIFIADEGLRYPEDGLYALDATARAKPDITAKFVRASLEAWTYAFDHTEETLDIVIRRMREARLPANRVHQRWMLDRMRDLMQPASTEVARGQLARADYLAVAESMRREKLVASFPPFEDFRWSADALQE